MPGVTSTGSSPLGLLRKSKKPQTEAPKSKTEEDVKPAQKEDGSDTSSVDSRTLVEPQQGHKSEMVKPYLGRGRDSNKLSRSEYGAAAKQTKKEDPDLYKQGTVQVRNKQGDVTHEITRDGFRKTVEGKTFKDDSYSGVASRHPVANTLTGGTYAGIQSAYRTVRPRPQEMVDGGKAASSSNLKIFGGLGALAVAGGGGYYFYTKSTGNDPLMPSNKQDPSSLPPGTVDPTQVAGYSGPPTQTYPGSGPVQIPSTASGTGGYTQVNY